ncbi:MAG: hypothetical protein LAP86_20310 [Acidobacteriia bacterium]|nr:hypothetical protein [Terriglobia bacterium]
MPKQFKFLPWTRTPLADIALAPTEAGVRRHATVSIQLVADGVQQGAPIEPPTEIALYGAGDVLRPDNAIITRMEPAPGSVGFEFNYFAHAEMVPADLAWRYTLDEAEGPNNARLRPWIALLALKDDEFVVGGAGTSPLPCITVTSPENSLPDLSQSWAWAHVQADSTEKTNDDDRVVTKSPSLCRLLCPRQLEKNKSYSVFLVPTYEAGRLRGLGESGNPSPWNAPAWKAAQNQPDLKLPYYARWRCTVSAQQDFEALATNLKPIDLAAVGDSKKGLCGETIFGGDPGYYPDYLEPLLTFVAQGALRTPKSEPVAYSQDGLTKRLTATLKESLAGEDVTEDGPREKDPLFTLPAYGCRFRREEKVEAPDDGKPWPGKSPWFNQVNLDRRYRIAAGTGARIVRRHQEEFLAQCWSQAGEILAANRLIMQVQVAKALNERIQEKHLSRLDPTLLVILGDRFLPALRGTEPGATLSASFVKSGVPSGVVSLVERKVLAKRTERVRREIAGTLRKTVSAPPLLGFPDTDYGIPATLEGGSSAVRKAGCWEPRADDYKEWTYALFPQTGQQQGEQLLFGVRPQTNELFYMKNIDAASVSASIAAQISAMPALQLRRRISNGGDISIEDPTLILRGPRIPTPMASYLAKESPEELLPGVNEVPKDRVGLLVTDTAYIEGFLVGCNHEMNQELLWREFPSDLRTTVFARFWDRGAPASDDMTDDIEAINTWGNQLGSNLRGGPKGQIVFIIRGEIVNRYPGFHVLLNQQSTKEWKVGAGTDIEPIFSGELRPDIYYCGFPVTVNDLDERSFFVLYQPPGRYRFGVDVGTRDPKKKSGNPPTTWDALSWPYVTVSKSGYVDFSSEIHLAKLDGRENPNDQGKWGANRHAASLASVMFQRPVRVVIPAGRLLP